MSQVPTVFVGGPFSAALIENPDRTRTFDPTLRSQFESIYQILNQFGARILSSHQAEKFGDDIPNDSVVVRDTAWLYQCDVYLGLLSLDPAGKPWRSDGTFVEIGQALSINRPVILLVEEPQNPIWSLYVRQLPTLAGVRVIELKQYQTDPEVVIRQAVLEPVQTRASRPAADMPDVASFLAYCRYQQGEDDVRVNGLNVRVKPGVFSPRYNPSAEFLMSRWKIPTGTRVLDMGCGCGVLGISALMSGAAFLTAVDVNPTAVENTRDNLRRYALTDRAEVLQSDGYAQVTGKYDVIVANPPSWDRRPADDLERACFDPDHTFLRTLIGGAQHHARAGAKMFLGFSDDGNYHLAYQLLQTTGWQVADWHIRRPVRPGGAVVLVLEADLR